jgi:hypothetical protein
MWYFVPSQTPENKVIISPNNIEVTKSKNDWTQVTSLNRKAKASNNHFIQLIPPTHNKYDVLSNLKEGSETPNPTYKKEESLNTRGNRINTRKIQLVKSAKVK